MNYNENYEQLSKRLYTLLQRKYEFKRGPFFAEELSNLAFFLQRKKMISNDEANKILNIFRVLKEIRERYETTSVDYQELKNLYVYFEKIDKNKQSTESELETLFRKLSMQSKDAIINENEFDNFKQYLHIERPIEKKFEQALLNRVIKNNKSILFVVGNVGDGKSHLLSYMQKKHAAEFSSNNIKIHNDATETDSPTSTAIETMRKLLTPFSDLELNNKEDYRLIVAINLGVLTNLVEELKQTNDFQTFLKFISDSQVLDSRKISKEDNPFFHLVSFTEQVNFEITDGKVSSKFYHQVLDKIYSKNDNNPFYIAYQNDMKNGMNKLLHTNYSWLLRTDFKDSLVYLLSRVEIEYKMIISARMLFNFLFDITMPRDEKSSYNSYLPYLLFDNGNRSELLRIISTLDPIKSQTRAIDELSVEIYQAVDTNKKVLELLGDESEYFHSIFESFKDQQDKFDNFINTFLRIKFLMNCEDSLFNHQLFNRYLAYYSAIQNEGDVSELFMLIKSAILKWNGDSHSEDCMIKSRGQDRIKVLLPIDFEPISTTIDGVDLKLAFEIIGNQEYEIRIDFRTFEILSEIENGYFLKEEDRQIAIQFDVLVNNIASSFESSRKNEILDVLHDQRFTLKKSMNKIILAKG